MAGEFAGTYRLESVQGLWVRPRGNGFEFVCRLGPGDQEQAREEVEGLATEVAAQLEFGTPVSVLFKEGALDDKSAVPIEIAR